MTNVVFILIDAFGADFISKTNYRNSTTPFIDQLKQRSIYTENMYSLAPYTEAALIATLGGEMTLDSGEYIKAIKNCSKVLAEEFKERGYYTLSTFTPYIYSDSLIRGVDEFGYTRSSVLSSIITFRLKGMKTKYFKNQFSEKDYDNCIDIIKVELKTMRNFLKNLKSNSAKTEMIKDKIQDIDTEKVLILVNEEIQKISQKNYKYVDELFLNWDNHTLFRIPNNNIKHKCSKKTRANVDEKYRRKIRQGEIKANKLNLRNNFVDFKYLLNLYSTEEQKIKFLYKTLRGYYQFYLSRELDERVNKESYGINKSTVSARTQFNYFGEKIKELDKMNKAYYTYIHLEDFHVPNMYFSYDSDDEHVIEEEFVNIFKYIENLPDNYQGNLITDLSALYIDSKLKKFIEEMESTLQNEVIFIVTADHGYSYYNRPPRPIEVNNFYQENFRIPFMLFGKSIEGKSVEGMYSSIDVPSTICYYADSNMSNPFNGKVIGVDKSRKIVFNEWLGPGCPDFDTNDIWYSVFDGRYKVSVKVNIVNEVEIKNVVSIFDLWEDKLEKCNLIKSKINDKNILELIEIINLRHRKLKDKHKS